MSPSIPIPSPAALRADLTDAALRRALPYVEPLARSETYASAVESMTMTGAWVSRWREQQQRSIALLAGHRTRQQRWEAAERAARERWLREHPRVERRMSTRVTSRRRPRVFWYEGGQGPVLLLLNGWTASGRMWPAAWVADLERRFTVVRVDSRGTGLSRTAPAPFTMRDLADDAADVLRSLTEEPALVLGLSMGGMIAQELALRHPRLVRHLLLVSTRPPAPAHIAGSSQVMAGTLARPVPGQPLEEFFLGNWAAYCEPGFPEREPALLEELVRQILARPTPRAGVLNQMTAIAGWHGSRRLASLQVPTTVVHGDSDPLMPVGNGMRLARLIPRARYVELSGIGHLVPHEAGEALLRLISEVRPEAPAGAR